MVVNTFKILPVSESHYQEMLRGSRLHVLMCCQADCRFLGEKTPRTMECKTMAGYHWEKCKPERKQRQEIFSSGQQCLQPVLVPGISQGRAMSLETKVKFNI